MLEVDIPSVVGELTTAFEVYEEALIGNEIATLNAMFWDSPHTTRFGPREAERLYGHPAIVEFRIRRGPIDQTRGLRNRRITTFGRDFGTANVEFIPAGTQKVGRQSQTWMRTEAGWKIVSAHVSFGE